MVVRCGDAVRVIVKETRHERTNDKVMCLKGLMDRRRLMHTPCNRLEVLDVENPWVEITIPANDIEGMVIKHVFAETIAYFDAYFKFAALGMGLQFFGAAKISLGIRRVFEHLPEFISITFRRFDLRWILNRKETRLVAINMHLPGR